MKVWDYLDEFAKALKEQLMDDEKRWGDTWLFRTRSGQEERTITKFNDYFDQYRTRDIPIPWLKIVGGAMICWIRETHKELWKE